MLSIFLFRKIRERRRQAKSLSSCDMKKKWLLFLLLAVLSAGIMGNTVYAWLIDRKEVKNTVGFVTNDIHIHEDFDPPGNVEPGQRIVKKPCLVNDSAIPVSGRRKLPGRFIAGS